MIHEPKIRLIAPGAKDHQSYFGVKIRGHYPIEPCIYPMPSSLFVLSEVAGRFHALRRLLVNNKIIDKNYHWTLGNGHLVVVGNCLDEMAQCTEALWLLYSLEERAKKEGGYLHFICGRNELYNQNASWKSTQPFYTKEQTKSDYPHAALFNGNGELWNWLYSKNVIEKIGDWLFMTSSINTSILRSPWSVASINKIVRHSFAAQPNSEPGNSLPEEVLVTSSGLFTDGARENDLTHFLAFHGASCIFTGLLPGDKIKIMYSGKVVNLSVETDAANLQALWVESREIHQIDARKNKESFTGII